MLQAVKQEEIFISRKFSCPKPEEGFLFPWVLFVLLLFPVQPVFDLEWRRVLLVNGRRGFKGDLLVFSKLFIGFESLFFFQRPFPYIMNIAGHVAPERNIYDKLCNDRVL